MVANPDNCTPIAASTGRTQMPGPLEVDETQWHRHCQGVGGHSSPREFRARTVADGERAATKEDAMRHIGRCVLLALIGWGLLPAHATAQVSYEEAVRGYYAMLQIQRDV